MRLQRKVSWLVLVASSLLPQGLMAQTVYTIPFASSGNIIELVVANRSSVAVGEVILAPVSLYRLDIAESLLARYGTVEDYKIVQEYVSSETDATIKLLLGRALKEFKPPVPSRTIPVSVLLDTLISTKHRVFAPGWLGDKNFVKELDNHLENAQKHLAKGDSVNCGKEVEKFQEKVNREYERTVENEKKNKPYDKRFVTVDGWKFLCHNAQYILDRLPRQGGKK